MKLTVGTRNRDQWGLRPWLAVVLFVATFLLWIPGQLYFLGQFWEGSLANLVNIALVLLALASAWMALRALREHTTQLLFVAGGLILLCVIGTQVNLFMELISYEFSVAESLDSITTFEFDPVNTPVVGYTMWLFQRMALLPGILAVTVSAISPHH